jgi:hypothetical protein
VRIKNQHWRLQNDSLKIIEILNLLKSQYHKWMAMLKLNIWPTQIQAHAIIDGMTDLKNIIEKLEQDIRKSQNDTLPGELKND